MKEWSSTNHASLLLWNIEGLRNAMANAPINTIAKHDAIILTETFLTEEYNIHGYYGIHSFAQHTEGRPAGGVSIFLKPSLGTIKNTIKDDNTVIIKTTEITIIGLYINPQTKAHDAIEKIMEAVSHTTSDKRILLAGDLNCRIDRPNHKTDLV